MMLSAQDAYDLAVAERSYLDPPEDAGFGDCDRCGKELYSRWESEIGLCQGCMDAEMEE